MKHLLRNLWIAALIVCCNFQQVSAQQLPPIPIDQDVRIGKLDNGLTYYIRKNSLPANRADFYIAQKVGSIQEEDNQRGLAHFLEHMCSRKWARPRWLSSSCMEPTFWAM